MQITHSLLRQGLLDLVPLSESSFSGTEYILNPPRFLGNSEALEKNRIYFATGPEVRPASPLPPGTVVFLHPDTQSPSYSSYMIRLPRGLRTDTVFNRVCAIFERWDQFRSELGALIDRQARVDEVLALGARELDNPILLHDNHYQILARSEEEPVFEPDRINHLIRALNLDPQYRQLERSPDFFRIPASVSEFSFLCCNSRSGKESYDYRIMTPDIRRPFTAADESVFRLMCGYVHRTMRRPSEQQRLFHGSTDAAGLRKIFQEALTHPAPEYQRLSRELVRFGWMPEHQYCVLVSHVTSSDAQTHAATLLCQQFERKLPQSSALLLSSQIVVVLNLSLNELTLEQLLHEAVYFLRDNFLKLGISNSAAGLSEIRRCYTQGCIALDHIHRGNSYFWRMHFKDMALSYILSNCAGELSPRAVCSQKLLELRKYDAAHNTDLYNTLRCYIECRFNALETTRKLFIHRSTFLYRLERAKTLFKIDLEDQDELLHIMISIRLLEAE